MGALLEEAKLDKNDENGADAEPVGKLVVHQTGMTYCSRPWTAMS